MIRSLFAQAKHQQLLQDLGLTLFLKLQGKKHLDHDGVDLVEVEHQISFAHFVEVFVEDLDKVVNGFEVEEVVVRDVDADAEVEAGVTSIDDFVVPKLNEVCVLGITNC